MYFYNTYLEITLFHIQFKIGKTECEKIATICLILYLIFNACPPLLSLSMAGVDREFYYMYIFNKTMLSSHTLYVCRFAVLVGLYSIGLGLATGLSTPAILEMHGDQRLATVYGLEMLFYGFGTSLSSPFSGN